MSEQHEEIARLKSLLGRYGAHVVDHESIDYLDALGVSPARLTAAEIEEIRGYVDAALASEGRA